MRKYIHPNLHEEVQANGGHYVLTDEFRLALDGERQILITKGHGVMDSSCCGFGGCSYVLVQGYIVEWKTNQDPRGQWISKVESIRDPNIKKQIEKELKRDPTIQQVNFL